MTQGMKGGERQRPDSMMNAKDKEFVMQDHDLQAHAVFAEPHLLGGEEKAWLAPLPGSACAMGARKVPRAFVEGLHTRKRHRKCIVHDTGNTQGIYDAASWY